MNTYRSALSAFAIFVALLFAGCDRGEEPPKAVLDDALKQRYPDTGQREIAETSLTTQYTELTKYTVTNHYKRQVRDEIFWAYEFDVNFVSTSYGESFLPEAGKKVSTPMEAKAVLGFVKRGNSWYSRQWQSNE